MSLSPDPERQLSEADIEAIAQAVHEHILDSFYSDIGRGVWGIFWRAIIIVALAVAAWGAMKSGHGGVFQ